MTYRVLLISLSSSPSLKSKPRIQRDKSKKGKWNMDPTHPTTFKNEDSNKKTQRVRGIYIV